MILGTIHKISKLGGDTIHPPVSPPPPKKKKKNEIVGTSTEKVRENRHRSLLFLSNFDWFCFDWLSEYILNWIIFSETSFFIWNTPIYPYMQPSRNIFYIWLRNVLPIYLWSLCRAKTMNHFCIKYTDVPLKDMFEVESLSCRVPFLCSNHCTKIKVFPQNFL